MHEMPPGLAHAFVLILGLIVGSFVNVLVVRLPERESVVSPGSHCPECGTAIRWRDNIPVLSYLLLGGKCRACREPISVRYPVIELLTAVLFLASEIRFGRSLGLFARDLPFVTILVAVTFIDLEHRIIPDVLSLGGLGLGIATSFFFGGPTQAQGIGAWIGAGVGFGAFYSLAWIYHKLTGRSGLGGGDVKLLAMLGAFIGVSGVFATILISSVFGSLVGIAWALWIRRRPGTSTADNSGISAGVDQSLLHASIPYGPFLVFGALYYYLLGDILWFQFTTPM